MYKSILVFLFLSKVPSSNPVCIICGPIQPIFSLVVPSLYYVASIRFPGPIESSHAM